MTHVDLIDRLKAGSGQDRGIDGRIALWRGWGCHFDWGDDPASAPHFDEWPDIGGHWCPPDAVDHSNPHKCTCITDTYFAEPPRWTESLDACIGLMKEVLPGCKFGLGHNDNPDMETSGHYYAVISPAEHKFFEAYADDLCRALMIAILQAVDTRNAG